MKILPFACFRVARWVALVLSLAACAAAVLRADAVFAWNEVVLHGTTAAAGGRSLHREARVLAMTHLAIASAIEAVSETDPDRRRDGRRAATVAAARDVLVSLLPGRAILFESLAQRHLAAIPESDARSRGLAAGAAAAERVLRQRAEDGWIQSPVPALETEPVPSVDPGDPAVAPPSPWVKLRPFILAKADQFAVAEVRVVRSNGEVVPDHALLGSRLFEGVDREAAAGARDGFWAQSPLAAWNRVGRQVAADRAIDLPEQARLLAALNLALADAVLAARQAQHEVGHWRSVTTEIWQPVDERLALPTDLVARVDDGFRQETVRLEYGRVLIPPVRNYPSVAAVLAGAAQAVLDTALRGPGTGFTLTAGAGARVYPEVAAAAREQAFVASLDGVHSREACVAGHQLGVAVGRHLVRKAALVQR